MKLTSSYNAAHRWLSITRVLLSFWITRQARFRLATFMGPPPLLLLAESLSVTGSGAGDGVDCSTLACCKRSSSHRARRRPRSCTGRRRMRTGAGELGTQEAATPALMQAPQGVLRSHLTLRCWQCAQAKMRVYPRGALITVLRSILVLKRDKNGQVAFLS